MREGKVVRISGQVVAAEGIMNPIMGEVVLVGETGLIGEVNRIDGNRATIQVYEDTTGLRNGDPVVGMGEPISAELGPGLLGEVMDGLQRPLGLLAEKTGIYTKPGVKTRRISHERRWKFIPVQSPPTRLAGVEIVGTVMENDIIEHRIVVPPDHNGVLVHLAEEGDYTITDEIGVIRSGAVRRPLKMAHSWPVKTPRPFREKLQPYEPLITGQRVIDFLFPLARGSAAAIPGPFGSGKTMTLQQIAKFSSIDIVIYVGCGERGNEIAGLLRDFKELKDPRSGGPLLDRSILIVNTSNMPVAAREASIFLGTTIAEYYRDMGYAVALIADSTSRWAEALREISARLEELPGEEGYPPYLASRLQSFYSRCGIVSALSGRMGSVSIMGAVSPPGGDFSEPVTQKTLQIVRALWSLDSELAYIRHYPAVNWLQSYSLSTDDISIWWESNVSERWRLLRRGVLNTLKEAGDLQQIVRLVGTGTLTEREKATLEVARVIRESFLQQSALDPKDNYSSPKKTFAIIEVIDFFRENLVEAVDKGIPVSDIVGLEIKEKIDALKALGEEECVKRSFALKEEISSSFLRLKGLK